MTLGFTSCWRVDWVEWKRSFGSSCRVSPLCMPLQHCSPEPSVDLNTWTGKINKQDINLTAKCLVVRKFPKRQLVFKRMHCLRLHHSDLWQRRCPGSPATAAGRSSSGRSWRPPPEGHECSHCRFHKKKPKQRTWSLFQPSGWFHLLLKSFLPWSLKTNQTLEKTFWRVHWSQGIFMFCCFVCRRNELLK